ncbi:MAG: (2Fe-2S)-binding protein [Beijerinckiaceae bacterium]
MIHFTLNQQPREVNSAPDKPLLWVLRDELQLTGTKYGCGQALCGACTVLIDGEPGRACQTTMADIEGRSVTTIEGTRGRVAEIVQQIWTRLDVPQCGYCQSGQVLAAIALLSNNPKPTDDDINDAMSGNLCRCNTYQRIRAAVHEAARLLGA